MWNEHFGIGVVEMMAAGVVPIAHDSGGPALDIVTTKAAAAQLRPPGEETGLLASTASGYADALEALLLARGAAARRERVAAAARAAVASRFSEARFADGLRARLRPLLAAAGD